MKSGAFVVVGVLAIFLQIGSLKADDLAGDEGCHANFTSSNGNFSQSVFTEGSCLKNEILIKAGEATQLVCQDVVLEMGSQQYCIYIDKKKKKKRKGGKNKEDRKPHRTTRKYGKNKPSPNDNTVVKDPAKLAAKMEKKLNNMKAALEQMKEQGNQQKAQKMSVKIENVEKKLKALKSSYNPDIPKTRASRSNKPSNNQQKLEKFNNNLKKQVSTTIKLQKKIKKLKGKPNKKKQLNKLQGNLKKLKSKSKKLRKKINKLESQLEGTDSVSSDSNSEGAITISNSDNISDSTDDSVQDDADSDNEGNTSNDDDDVDDDISHSTDDSVEDDDDSDNEGNTSNDDDDVDDDDKNNDENDKDEYDDDDDDKYQDDDENDKDDDNDHEEDDDDDDDNDDDKYDDDDDDSGKDEDDGDGDGDSDSDFDSDEADDDDDDDDKDYNNDVDIFEIETSNNQTQGNQPNNPDGIGHDKPNLRNWDGSRKGGKGKPDGEKKKKKNKKKKKKKGGKKGKGLVVCGTPAQPITYESKSGEIRVSVQPKKKGKGTGSKPSKPHQNKPNGVTQNGATSDSTEQTMIMIPPEIKYMCSWTPAAPASP